MTTPPRTSVELALDVVRWSLRFYRRHVGMVVGISLIASVQRASSQLWGDRVPALSGGTGEMLTAIARLVLFVLILRLAILNEDRLREVAAGEAVQRIVTFVRRSWRSVVVQVLLFATLFVMVDLVPDFVIAPRIPADARPAYWATLLAVKNPTVIAFAMIWQVGAARQALLLGGPDATAERDLAVRGGAVGDA